MLPNCAICSTVLDPILDKKILKNSVNIVLYVEIKKEIKALDHYVFIKNLNQIVKGVEVTLYANIL